MKLTGVACELPKKIVKNSEIISFIESKSSPNFEGDLTRTLKLVNALLKKSGFSERRMLERGEDPMEYIFRAAHSALDEAQLAASDIDLVIHAGIDRRFAEPGMSFLYANALKMHQAECFDILEACASWVRAAEIAQGLMSVGRFKNVMIITAEFGMHDGEDLMDSLCFDKPEDIDYYFSAATLGESATVSILSAEGDIWDYANKTANNYAALCTIPTGKTDYKLGFPQELLKKPLRKFYCQAPDMALAGLPLCEKVFVERYGENIADIDIVFPHSHTLKGWTEQADAYQLDVPYYFSVQRTGNLGPSSIPAAIALAKDDGKLKRGDRVAVWMVAAGISVTSFDFIF